MYFDFDDNHPDIPHVPHALTWRDGFFLALTIHLLAIIAVLAAPPMDRTEQQERIARQLALQQQRERDAERFVFVQPHLDTPAVRPPAPNANASDKDRNIQTREKAPNPVNALPFSRGNTFEKEEIRGTPPPPRADTSQPPRAPAAPAQGATGQSSAEAGSPPPSPATDGFVLNQAPRAGTGRVPDAPGETGAGAGQGLLGSAMRDLQRYARSEAFDNQGGGNGQFGPAIQFDTKGVEFGPWVRRFLAQVKRNWIPQIPYAAMALKGHVVVTFNVHKDGSITDISVPGPCAVEGFNKAAFGAMNTSNPTYPLPPEYPTERAFFTVTFFYNEVPPGGGS